MNGYLLSWLSVSEPDQRPGFLFVVSGNYCFWFLLFVFVFGFVFLTKTFELLLCNFRYLSDLKCNVYKALMPPAPPGSLLRKSSWACLLSGYKLE